jgi:hypothetical protein
VLWSLVLVLLVGVIGVVGVVGDVRCFQNMSLLLLATGVRGILLFRRTSITDGVVGDVVVLVVAMEDGGLGGGDDPMRTAFL